MIDRKTATRFWLILALIVGPLGLSCAEPEERPPNIVLILADDMGYSDIGAFGSEIQTPHLDRLARNGLRFTDFHNTPRCMPTRASLMTGQYPHRTGMGEMSSDYGHPGYRGDLNRETVTIPEVLQTAGYKNYMSGKWHVTRHIGHWTGEEELTSKHNWPIQRGFDRFFGTILGAGSFYDPNTLTNQNEPVSAVEAGFFYTDAINDSAATFIRRHVETDNAPFFLYVAHTAPHWPLHAYPEDIARYDGVYDDGWDALRTARYERMVELGFIDASWTLSDPYPKAPVWENLTEEERTWYIRAMEVYAAQVDRMDQGIGRVVQALEETGQLENTLLIFLSDNGACAEILSDAWNGPYIARQTRIGESVTVGNEFTHRLPGPENTFMSYGIGWANASNTPFRLFKHYNHEGGMSSPFIVHWPKKVLETGSMKAERGQLIDLMATFVEVSGANYPKVYNGEAIAPLPGISLLPAIEGSTLPTRPLFFEHEGNRAVLAGDWKLVALHDRPWELYRIREDRTETNDLAATYPDKVNELVAQYDAWAADNYVLPWPIQKLAANTEATP